MREGDEMKIREAIGQVDNWLTNIYTTEDKIGWLSQLDMKVKTQIIDTHEGGEDLKFQGYAADVDQDTVLLVPAPYDELYLRYLEAQIHYRNQEEDRCNNANDAFQKIWNEFRNEYNRKHMPKGQKLTV